MFQLNIIGAPNFDLNGSCNYFVKVEFLPESEFSNVVMPKTKTQPKPFFDEEFSIQLTEKHLMVENPMLLFSIIEKNLIFPNKIMAETLISLETIQCGKAREQIQLTLTRPNIRHGKGCLEVS